MIKRLSNFLLFSTIISIGLFISSCSIDDGDNPPPDSKDTTDNNPPPFDIDDISDTYPDVVPYALNYKWGPYNVHDPSIFKEGDYFYCYSTDVGYGIKVPPGIQMRKSKDLVDWQYVGLAFNELPQMGANYIKSKGGEPFNALWAPEIVKVGDEFRLYYSLSSPTPRLSVIGLATASSPIGPWTEKGLVVTSDADNTVQTNAIDPTVIIDQSGQQWFYYGSAWDGIYILKLDPETGLAVKPGDKGKRIAQRGFTGNDINGNIEGSKIIYNPDFNKYYLFMSYDWLETKYNVRVGRSDTPEGPFYDFKGNDLNEEEDNIPMIIAPYRFEGHGGWQGVAHPAVFEDDGQFYIGHQGRPGVDKYYMVLHVRKLYWTEDEWPVASPERYAGLEQTAVAQNELTGNWERIVLNYQVVPGYANEQISPDFQDAVDMTLNADGTINGDQNNTWSYHAPWLEMNWNGTTVDKVYVERGRDWENKIERTIIFTGLNNEGTAIWGKQKNY